MTTIARSTSRGQITLPQEKDTVIFDADRDTNGKSPDIDLFIDALINSPENSLKKY